MSVLACDRTGCENIMCDYFSDRLQAYLCTECRDELIRKLKCNQGTSIVEFMDSEKSNLNDNIALAIVNAEFIRR